MSSKPSYSLEHLSLGVKVFCLLFFTEKSYKGFKLLKILKKNTVSKKLYLEFEPEQQQIKIRKEPRPNQLGHKATFMRGEMYFKINIF